MQQDSNGGNSSDSDSGMLRLFTFGVPFILVLVMMVIVAGGGGYIVYKYPKLFGLNVSPSDAAGLQIEADALIQKVGMLMELPPERPTIATVSNVEVLRQSQPFFEKAENGDRVLIYTGARKTILYRESTNKIIDVGAVNIQDSTVMGGASAIPVATPVPTPTPEVTSSPSPSPTSSPVATSPTATLAPTTAP